MTVLLDFVRRTACGLHGPTQLAGTWALAPGTALTLRPRGEAARLQAVRGRLWVTFDGPHGASPESSGDCILEEGESLLVADGRRVVVESLTKSEGGARFGWEASPRGGEAKPTAEAMGASGSRASARGCAPGVSSPRVAPIARRWPWTRAPSTRPDNPCRHGKAPLHAA